MQYFFQVISIKPKTPVSEIEEFIPRRIQLFETCDDNLFDENIHEFVNNGDVIVSVKDLVVQFAVRGRTLTAIRKISLDIYKGETIAIVGESGSGKSSLLNVFSEFFL